MIFYTGIGANPNGIHTDEEFIEIMKNQIVSEWNYDLQFCSDDEKNNLTKFKDYILPHDFILFSFEDWLDYSGANIINQKNYILSYFLNKIIKG